MGCWIFPAESDQPMIETLEPDPGNAGGGNGAISCASVCITRIRMAYPLYGFFNFKNRLRRIFAL